MEKGQSLYQELDTDNRQTLEPELMSIMKEEIGKAKEGRIPIIRAFEAIAKRSGLKANTIRNYYYRYIHSQEDRTLVDSHSREDTPVLFTSDAIGRAFTGQETRTLMREMLIAQGRNESVRGCANRLAGGNKRVLIRLQNKYRSIIARDPDYVKEIIKELEEEGKVCFNPYTRRRIRSIVSSSFPSKSSQTATSYKDYDSDYKKSLYSRAFSSRDDSSGGQLLELMGQFVANIRDINTLSIDSLITGLRDLSSLALGNKRGMDYLASYEDKIRDLKNEITLLNAVMNRDRDHLSRIEAKYRSLVNTCKDYLGLSDTDKLAQLNSFLAELKTYIVDV